jgi:hypothetical protein
VACLACDTPTSDGLTLCTRCESTLMTTLTHVHDTLTAAQTTIRKQDNVTRNRGGGSDPTTRSPVNFTAVEDADDLREKVRGWADVVHERDLIQNPDTARGLFTVRDDVYLRMSVDIIRLELFAGDLHMEITDAHRKLLRTIDLPPDYITFGHCTGTLPDDRPCHGIIRSTPGAPFARCRACSATYAVRTLQSERLATAWHIRAPLKQVVSALRHTGLPLNINTAKSWVRRGHLQALWHDAKGVALYTPAQLCDALARKDEIADADNDSPDGA